MDDYATRLIATKGSYPFAQWATNGMPQYTNAACARFAAIFDSLIQTLIDLGEQASEEKKVEAFHIAVLALNALNEEDESLIETEEREDLCELCNIVATAAGLHPQKYGDGEGLASEWRNW